jgi:inositol-pentakisphosphate 2-kinase
VFCQDDIEQLSCALESFFGDGTAHGERVGVLLRLVIAALLQHDALRRLLAVQKLDTQDVEGAYQARFPYSNRGAHRYSRGLCAGARGQAYEALLKDANGVGAATDSEQPECQGQGTMPRGRALAVLRDFLTAQSAKDCAVMVALQPSPVGAADASHEDTVVADAASNLTFRCKAAFVDLDVKRVAKMPQYLALDRAVVALFEEQTCCCGQSNA